MSEPATSVRAHVVRWARVAVAISLVAFLLGRAGLGDLASMRDTARPGYLALALLIVPLSVLVRAYNHSLLLNRGERVVGLADMVRLALVGVGINLIVPTGLADLAKAHYGYRLHGNAEAMVISSVLDKITSLTAVAALGVLGAAVAGEPAAAVLSGLVFLGTLVPFVAPHHMPWRLVVRLLAPKADLAEERLELAATTSWSLLTKVLAISVIGWVLTYSIVYLCCLGVGARVGPAYIFALAPFATLVRLVPVSAGGIGLGEITLAALLVRAGVPQQFAAQAALAQMVSLTFVPGAAGLVLLARGRRAAAEAS